MHKALVFLALFVNLIFGFSAFAKLDCRVYLRDQVGFMNEAFSDALGKPLVDNDNNPVAGKAYTRVHDRTVGETAESQVPVKIAVIESKDWSPEFEENLKAAGYLGVSIRNPDDATIAAHTDFTLTPEWLRMVMPKPAPKPATKETPALTAIEAWLEGMDGKDRSQIKRKLKKSEKVKSEVADLDWADYELWREELFNKEIMTRNGGVRAWNKPEIQAPLMGATFDPTKPLKGQMIPKFKRVFFYSEPDATGATKLIGGSLIQFDADEMMRVRAAAFEKEARKHLELALRAFVIGMELAQSSPFPYVSYGDDLGVFGIDTTLGLLQFKSMLGMWIVPSPLFKTMQLLKIFPEGQALLRKEVEQGKYSGLLILGIAGDDPQRLEKLKLLQDARDPKLSYEERAAKTAEILVGLQIGADAGTEKNPPKLPPGIKLRRIGN